MTEDVGGGTSTNDSPLISQSRSTYKDISQLSVNEEEKEITNYAKALPTVLDDDAFDNIQVNNVNSCVRMRSQNFPQKRIMIV